MGLGLGPGLGLGLGLGLSLGLNKIELGSLLSLYRKKIKEKQHVYD
jgi:hypothetical protein